MTLWLMIYSLILETLQYMLGISLSAAKGILVLMSYTFASKAELKILNIAEGFSEGASIDIQSLRSHLP